MLLMEQEIQMEKKKKSPVLKWLFVLSIAIVLNLFLEYAVDVVYHQPKYEDYCPMTQVIEDITTQDRCLEIGGQWNPNMTKDRELSPGYCDQEFTCRQKFEDTQSVYNRNLFIVFVVAGALSLIASLLLSSAEAVSLGLSFGGVLSFIIGSTTYWSDMNDLLRVGILGLALVTLIWLAYKKFQD